jgi:alkylhydroperoxidase family enzyme
VARISYVDPSTITDPHLRAPLEMAERRGTPRPESQAVRAHVPGILRTFSETWEESFYRGVVPHEIKELCRMYVSKTGACEYCGTQRSEQSRQLSDRDYDELLDFRNSSRYDDRQKAALEWTDVIIWDPNSAGDELWERLHRHFTEPELVELGYFIALTLGQQRWLATLDLQHGEVHVDAAGQPEPQVPSD